MPKNIVLLSDGTGNSAAKLFRTNVWRLHQALDLRTGDQIASYDEGVGTESFRPLALLGEAVGFGLARNIKQLYAFLCRNYEPEDRVFLFGFSRGAFTVRRLVGLINDQGIVTWNDEADLQHKVDAAFDAYRASHRSLGNRFRRTLTARLGPRVTRVIGAAPVRQRHPTAPAIAFLGVWDTVAAYGLPIAELAEALDHLGLWDLGFPDRRLSPIVRRACHALALDDERHTFHPVLWDEAIEPVWLAQGHIQDAQRITQVWFAGVHSNVGGGYPKDELAHVSLRWMMSHALAAGLRFLPNPPSAVSPQPNAHGEVYDSRSGLKGYYRYKPRRVAELCDDRHNHVTIDWPKVHHSVFDRLRENQIPYPSFNIPARYEVLEPGGGLARPGAPGAYETEDWAAWRERRQERTWDVVFRRRIIYFMIVAASVAAALAPAWLTWSPDRACAGRLCVLDPVVGFLGALLPGFAAPWVTAFRQNLWVLFGFVAVFALLLWRNAELGGVIAAHADAAWRHVTHGMPGPAPPPEPRTRTTRLRTVLGGPYRAWVQSVFPWLAAILIAVLAIAAVATRIIFDVRSSLGFVCTATPSASLREPRPTQSLLFATVEGCAPTGIKLHAGQRYAVEVGVLAPWKDGDLVASPDGLEAPRWWMAAAVPMRRIWTAPWFRLMGRIGDTGDDHYPLRSGRTAFRARTDGELFLYVNDVVIGIAPKRWDRAYSWRWGRNEGTATIQVTRLP